MINGVRRVLFALGFLCCAAALAARGASAETSGSPSTTWQAVSTPAPGEPASIGDYSAGCIQGAQALALNGPGYQVAHPERHRNFGHPDLLAMLTELGRATDAAGLGRVMLGDLAQPRGGPAKGGHASHQTGLDVDIWYSMPAAAQKKPLPANALVDIKPRSVLDGKTQSLRGSDTARVAALLRFTAQDPHVERIFVHAGIKRSLCEQTKDDRAWLGKLRPWFGHDDHFHVRLSCPKSSPDCKPQAPLPAGDGCENVDWWFSAEGRKDREDEQKRYHAKVVKPLQLPARCQSLLD